jgi:RNA polymerase sigma-70 factor, ECF subfamily
MQYRAESKASPAEAPKRAPSGLDFDAVYHEMADFVWRAARRMGVSATDAEDVVQEVFVIVHRRLAEFEGRAQLKTWLFRILVRLVKHHFRTQKRKPGDRATESGTELQSLVSSQVRGPADALERAEALRLVDRLLSRLDHDKRVVFVLAEMEEMTLAEIAEVVESNPNTVASRLRAARKEFDAALSRFKARESRDKP